MSQSPVRFGLIGCGAWGSHHAAAIDKTQGACLAAIAEQGENARAAAVLSSGKHLLLEKPMCLAAQQSVDTGRPVPI